VWPVFVVVAAVDARVVLVASPLREIRRACNTSRAIRIASAPRPRPATSGTGFVPVRYMIVWQSILHMIQFGLRDNDRLYRFTRRSLIRTCGAHLGKAQLFESEFRGRLSGAASEADVSRVMDDFRTEWARGRRVQVVAEPPEF
jgi:hypothetical protein